MHHSLLLHLNGTFEQKAFFVVVYWLHLSIHLQLLISIPTWINCSKNWHKLSHSLRDEGVVIQVFSIMVRYVYVKTRVDASP